MRPLWNRLRTRRDATATLDTASAPRQRKMLVAVLALFIGLGLLAVPFLVPYGWLGGEASAIASWLLGILAIGYGGSRLDELRAVARAQDDALERQPVETRVIELRPDVRTRAAQQQWPRNA